MIEIMCKRRIFLWLLAAIVVCSSSAYRLVSLDQNTTTTTTTAATGASFNARKPAHLNYRKYQNLCQCQAPGQSVGDTSGGVRIVACDRNGNPRVAARNRIGNLFDREDYHDDRQRQRHLSSSKSSKSGKGKGGSKSGSSKSKKTPVFPCPTPTPAPPTPAPPRTFVQVRDFFMAYAVPGLTQLPSRRALNQLLGVTKEFWTRFFELQFGTTNIEFLDVALTIDETRFGAGVPSAEFNFWVDYDMQLEYALGSQLPPNGQETFEIMQTADLDAYIASYVQTVNGFESTNDVALEPVDDFPTKSPIDFPTQSPSSSPTAFPTPVPTFPIGPVDMIRVSLGGLQFALDDDEQAIFQRELQELVGPDFKILVTGSEGPVLSNAKAFSNTQVMVDVSSRVGQANPGQLVVDIINANEDEFIDNLQAADPDAFADLTFVQAEDVPDGPTKSPTVSEAPSYAPSGAPSIVPSGYPTAVPSVTPTYTPSVAPSGTPTSMPSDEPTLEGTREPSFSRQPSAVPTESQMPSAAPSDLPSSGPTDVPTLPIEAEEFNIELELQGSFFIDAPFVQSAARRWEEIIVGDRPEVDVTGNRNSTICSGGLPQIIDDIHVCGVFRSIDGLGGIVGVAGPRLVYPDPVTGQPIPVNGDMLLDITDMGFYRFYGTVESLIAHEIGHILGIGTLWNQAELVADRPSCFYNLDSAASREYQRLSGCSGPVPIMTEVVPAEGGGELTSCLHWDDNCFRNEIMSVSAYTEENLGLISRVTIGGLEDLGYVVNYDAADEYTVADLDDSCVCSTNGQRRDLTLRFQDIHGGDGGHSELFGGDSDKPELSAKGEQEARDYGASILEERRKQASTTNDGGMNLLNLVWSGKPESSKSSPSLHDMGQDVTFVLYQEGKNMFVVPVWASDLL